MLESFHVHVRLGLHDGSSGYVLGVFGLVYV